MCDVSALYTSSIIRPVQAVLCAFSVRDGHHPLLYSLYSSFPSAFSFPTNSVQLLRHTGKPLLNPSFPISFLIVIGIPMLAVFRSLLDRVRFPVLS
jgi:hypothetical protein